MSKNLVTAGSEKLCWKESAEIHKEDCFKSLLQYYFIGTYLYTGAPQIFDLHSVCEEIDGQSGWIQNILVHDIPNHLFYKKS